VTVTVSADGPVQLAAPAIQRDRNPSRLAMTGADSSAAAGLAVALLLVGGLLMRLNRRKVPPD